MIGIYTFIEDIQKNAGLYMVNPNEFVFWGFVEGDYSPGMVMKAQGCAVWSLEQTPKVQTQGGLTA